MIQTETNTNILLSHDFSVPCEIHQDIDAKWLVINVCCKHNVFFCNGCYRSLIEEFEEGKAYGREWECIKCNAYCPDFRWEKL